MPIEDLMKRYGYSLDGGPSPTEDPDQWSSGSSNSSDQTYRPPNPKLFNPPPTDRSSTDHRSPTKNVPTTDQLQVAELVEPCAADLAPGHAAENVPELLVGQSDNNSSLVSRTKRVVGRKPATHPRHGADPEALARLRPVPERRSMRPIATGSLESTFGKFCFYAALYGNGGNLLYPRAVCVCGVCVCVCGVCVCVWCVWCVCVCVCVRATYTLWGLG